VGVLGGPNLDYQNRDSGHTIAPSMQISTIVGDPRVCIRPRASQELSGKVPCDGVGLSDGGGSDARRAGTFHSAKTRQNATFRSTIRVILVVRCGHSHRGPTPPCSTLPARPGHALGRSGARGASSVPEVGVLGGPNLDYGLKSAKIAILGIL